VGLEYGGVTMSYEYVKQYYGVNPEVGMRVKSQDGKKAGVIVGKPSYDHYVHVRLDGQEHDVPFHPLDLIYPDADRREKAGAQ
jgi:hypothetical protein